MTGGRRAAGWLGALAVASALYAGVLFVTGGFETEWLGLRLRSRGWERPALVALAVFLLATIARLRGAPDEARRAWAAFDSRGTARFLAGAAIAWALFAGIRYGSFVAGGSDSFGYVSQARLFTHGALTDVVPMRPEYTWRDAELSLVPLAYRPATEQGRMSPVYPPGLPLMMAVLLPFGERLMYGLVPVFGACLVLATALVGARLGDPLAGAAAAWLLSVSATFLLMQFAPMSDVPVSALWLGAMLCAAAGGRGAGLAAGTLAGLAILTRPNLAPLVLVPGVLVAVGRKGRTADLVAFSAPVAGALAALLWIQWYRYGDPLASGYGSTAELFALTYVASNATSYAARITALYSPVIWLWLVAPVFPAGHVPRAFLAACVVLVVGVWLAYLPYLPFEAWHFTRFLLPAIPVMLVLAAMVVFAGIRRLPAGVRPAASIAFVVVMTLILLDESRRRQVFESGSLEQKYPQAGRYVRDHLPEGTYVLAVQHSGSIRHYSGRPTIRWDVVGGDQLDLVVETVRRVAGSIYLVADEDEVPRFTEHFQGQASAGRLRLLATFGRARVYAVE